MEPVPQYPSDEPEREYGAPDLNEIRERILRDRDER